MKSAGSIIAGAMHPSIAAQPKDTCLAPGARCFFGIAIIAHASSLAAWSAIISGQGRAEATAVP